MIENEIDRLDDRIDKLIKAHNQCVRDLSQRIAVLEGNRHREEKAKRDHEAVLEIRPDYEQ